MYFRCSKKLSLIIQPFIPHLSEEIWKQFAELGWLALPFEEKDGGFGGNLIDLMIIMKSFGEGLVVEPYMSTAIISGGILSLCPNSEIKSQLIKDIIEGKILVSFAFSEPNSRFNTSDIKVSAELDGRINHAE